MNEREREREGNCYENLMAAVNVTKAAADPQCSRNRKVVQQPTPITFRCTTAP